MHNSNQTTIGGVNVSHALIFTGNQCKREYAIANSLLEHVNVFDKQLPELDYVFFSELRGSISSIDEEVQSTNYTETRPRETHERFGYLFTPTKELQCVTRIQGDLSDELRIFDSLKKRHKVVKTRTIDSRLYSVHHTYFNETMGFDRFEEHLIYKDEIRKTPGRNLDREKYFWKNGKVTKKVRFINNKREQSKVVHEFYDDSNVVGATAYSQKNKWQILYKSDYAYDEQMNICSIIFENLEDIQHPKRKEYTFEYDHDGKLTRYDDKTIKYDGEGNITQISNGLHGEMRFKKVFSFQYDAVGNWVRKDN